mmetsp:Transcript_43157/g.101885  ORF Transcript_43157/g.101885 Transcript_43157/m.101885 type:complete len:433 (+) Transcript_43157:109-1407(+)
MPPSMAEVLNGGAGRITTLRQGLNVELAFIQRIVKQGTESTATQMKDYLVNLGKKIQGEVHHAGMEGIREQLVASFKQIGWDLAQNEPAGDLPTLKDLEKWLSGLVKTYFQAERQNHEVKKASEKATAAELQDFALACERIWWLDDQRCVPGKDYVLQPQRYKNSSWNKGDEAPLPLFKWVKDDVLQRDTFKHFISLLDNYIAETGQTEDYSAEEKVEMNAFLSACCKTRVMQYLGDYLKKKGKIRSDSENDLKIFLHELWFKLYRREAHNDSSGFEHVFVGEVKEKGGERLVIGMHNWLQIYVEEQRGHLNYMGYLRPKRRGTNSLRADISEEQMLSMQFTWKDAVKPVGTSFIGPSPEFELALYTLCFLFGTQENYLTIGPYQALIKCYHHQNRHLGTSYPEEPPMTKDEAATKIQSKERTRITRKQMGR